MSEQERIEVDDIKYFLDSQKYIQAKMLLSGLITYTFFKETT